MGDVAELVKTAYEMLRSSEDVPISVEARKLGMAYAIPRGTEDTVVNAWVGTLFTREGVRPSRVSLVTPDSTNR